MKIKPIISSNNAKIQITNTSSYLLVKKYTPSEGYTDETKKHFSLLNSDSRLSLSYSLPEPSDCDTYLCSTEIYRNGKLETKTAIDNSISSYDYIYLYNKDKIILKTQLYKAYYQDHLPNTQILPFSNIVENYKESTYATYVSAGNPIPYDNRMIEISNDSLRTAPRLDLTINTIEGIKKYYNLDFMGRYAEYIDGPYDDNRILNLPIKNINLNNNNKLDITETITEGYNIIFNPSHIKVTRDGVEINSNTIIYPGQTVNIQHLMSQYEGMPFQRLETSDETIISEGNYTPTETITLKAVYLSNKFTVNNLIKFNTNTGKVNTKTMSIEIPETYPEMDSSTRIIVSYSAVFWDISSSTVIAEDKTLTGSTTLKKSTSTYYRIVEAPHGTCHIYARHQSTGDKKLTLGFKCTQPSSTAVNLSRCKNITITTVQILYKK